MYDNVLFIPMYARANVMAYGDRFVYGPTSVIAGMFWDSLNWDVK